MMKYQDLLMTAVAAQKDRAAPARLALYAQARNAMLDRLHVMSPSLPLAEIEAETRRFDEAVAGIERDLAPASRSAAPMAKNLPDFGATAMQPAAPVSKPVTALQTVQSTPRMMQDGKVEEVRSEVPPERARSIATDPVQRQRRKKSYWLGNLASASGFVAIVALAAVHISHPLPGNLQVRVRWDQLFASPSHAESVRAFADAQPERPLPGAIATAATAPPAIAPVESSYHDVALSHLPPPVRNLLRVGEKRLRGYRLRDVFAEYALVDAPFGMALVTRGANLRGAGEVTSIEKRAQSWVVTTTGGEID